MLETFSGYVSWTYNYALTPVEHSVDWINENGIEFVPMVHNVDSECDMWHEGNDPNNFCTVDMLVEKIEAS
jgi:hypothetical protein